VVNHAKEIRDKSWLSNAGCNMMLAFL